jgi:hypothetical protein
MRETGLTPDTISSDRAMGGDISNEYRRIEGHARIMRADVVHTAPVEIFPCAKKIGKGLNQCSCRGDHRLHWLVADSIRDDRGDVLWRRSGLKSTEAVPRSPGLHRCDIDRAYRRDQGPGPNCPDCWPCHVRWVQTPDRNQVQTRSAAWS